MVTARYEGRPLRYAQLLVLIAMGKPATIVEVGTNLGDGAEPMCREALRHRKRVHYRGFDVFDTKDAAFHAAALNGKGFTSRDAVAARLDRIRADHPGFSYDLVVGETAQTLHGHAIGADFVFIDGDHRIEAIEKDYAALATSRVVVLDDYYSDAVPEKVDAARLGCRSLVDRLPQATILPIVDVFEETVGPIRLAVVTRPRARRRAAGPGQAGGRGTMA